MKILLTAAFSAPATARALPPEPPQTSTSTAVALSTEAAVALSSAPAEPEEAAPVPRPWVLGEIGVSGNVNVKASVVRSQAKARKGDLYDRPDLDRDVQTLLGLGNFERVAADITLTSAPVPAQLRGVAGAPFTVKLTFIVKEKALIKKVRFVGNRKVSKGVLGDATTLKGKDPLDSLKLHEDEGKILDKYKEKGFLDASVRSEVVLDTATLQADVVYTISEGPKSRIAAVVIDGVSAFKPKKVLKQMEKNRRKKVFVRGELEADLKKVETFYLNNGYLDVEVGTATVEISDDKTKITIRFPVKEGRSYKFGDSTFSGHEIYASTELARALEYRKGKTFHQERYEESIRAIQELYADKGRLRAKVTPTRTFNQASGLMDVAYAITEGPIHYIDHVDVEGNKATKTYVFKREIVVKPGEPFSASRIRRSREKILNLGFIDDVDVGIEPTEAEKVDITFDVLEGKPGLLTAGAAYSSVDGFIGTLSMSHLNLFGRAQQVKVEWQFGGRVQDYFVSWRTPWIMNRPTSLGLDVFNTRRISPFGASSTAYVRKERGGSIHLGPRFKEDKYILNFTYTYSQISISNVEEIFRGPLQEGESAFSSVSAAFSRDTRDSIWDPNRGSRNTISTQLAGGPLQGDINFFTPSMSNAWHKTLATVGEYPLVLTFANRTAYVTQFGKTRSVPVQNRYFVGGQDTLRGYASTGEVGYPSGGKVLEVANLELGFPLARERRKTIVKIVAFVDIGTTWDRVKDISARIGSQERDLKTDAGMGIRFTTPAFPIRLDWGYGFNHRKGERLYQINFGLGNLF